MILRLAAAGSVALGIGIVSLYLGEVGKAPWSKPPLRHLRQMKDRDRAPDHYEPIPYASMSSLPRAAPPAVYGALERRGVTVEGYVQAVGRAADGDYHLDFAPSVDPDGDFVPYLSAEITPQWQRGSTRWRFERLLERLRPYLGGRTRGVDAPRRVRLSGWLMYDFPYEGAPPPRGLPPHVTQWEIHPVTRIEVWDDSLERFLEYPR